MRIAYQGDIGSNAYAIALRYARKQQETSSITDNVDMPSYELIPCVTSDAVATALTFHTADIGVMALHNNLGGEVAETKTAIEKHELEEPIELMSRSIHHNLYVYPGATISDIREIASHEQALLQTAKTRGQKYPDIPTCTIPDTAIGAKWLHDGTLPADIAVLCPYEAGTLYELDLLDEKLEDDVSVTTFGIFLPPEQEQ